MTQVKSVLSLSLELSSLKEQKALLHVKLIEVNRLVKRGESVPEAALDMKKQIADLTSTIRSMEHDLSILTLTVMRTAIIEETPYGRTIKYEEK
jgi:hypothetical protein